MTGRDEADRVLEVITVDCYNASEQVTAFSEVFAEEVPLPTTATLVGATVRVLGIDIAEHGEELTARCQRAEVASDLRLSDLVFPPDAAAAWIHAAYSRCLGQGRIQQPCQQDGGHPGCDLTRPHDRPVDDGLSGSRPSSPARARR